MEGHTNRERVLWGIGILVVLLYALTFALQVGLFSLLFTLLTAQGLDRLPTQVIGFVVAQGVATTVNFIVQRSVIFRLPR